MDTIEKKIERILTLIEAGKQEMKERQARDQDGIAACIGYIILERIVDIIKEEDDNH